MAPYKDKQKQSAYQREAARKARKAWLLNNGPCKKCGSKNRLEVDHVDPKSKQTHRVWSWSIERRLKELAKCQVLCAECHLIKTTAERTKHTHGRERMYKLGCRCLECKAAKSASDKKYRAPRRAKIKRP